MVPYSDFQHHKWLTDLLSSEWTPTGGYHVTGWKPAFS